MSEKTVFISYRRDVAGMSFARSLELSLTQSGYDVFLDVDCIEAGGWADQVLIEVPRRSHFLLVLTPGALDRCANEDDWVRREFALAVEHGRNIVPVQEESVDLAKLREQCPECMKGLFAFQVASIRHAAFEHDMETLLERYIPRHKAPQEAPGPAAGGVGDCVVSPTRLRHVADKLIGRDVALQRLDAAWDDPKTRVLVIRAWGGVGKTSLVAEWMARMAKDGWRGARRVFDWTFYSQGTCKEGEDADKAASADRFIAEALKFFGDADPQAGSPWDRGARLAKLVGKMKSLLVLDGLEPLQHPPGPLQGQLKDPAVAALLKGLSQESAGLCVVTTREHVADLAPFYEKTAADWELEHLSEDAGAELLRHLKVKGTEAELKKASKEVKGHALTLQLLGGYLSLAHEGDIRKRDLVGFQQADDEVQGGHAFRVLDAYERWFEKGDDGNRRQLAVLRLLGLFDRPADAGCLAVLRAEPRIRGLTHDFFQRRAGLLGFFKPRVPISEPEWNIAVKRLEEIGLLAKVEAHGKEATGGDALEAHPLLREHFGRKLREGKPHAWREGHSLLFEHLKASAPHWPEGLEGLEPLYQAVAHGCHAGRHQEACDEVYRDRILRGTGPGGNYSAFQLGAFGSDLGAIACFFVEPWRKPVVTLKDECRAWLFNEAALALRALGRLKEALEPMRYGLEMRVEQKDWMNAAVSVSNLSQLELCLGDVAVAVRDAERSVGFAEQSGDAFQRMAKRITLADALHQAGQRPAAETHFLKAEALQAEHQPGYPFLYSASGFFFCDLLLAPAERAVWAQHAGVKATAVVGPALALAACQEASRRAATVFEWRGRAPWNPSADSLLDIALDHLTLGRAALYVTLLAPGPDADALRREAREHVHAAVDGLRSAGMQEFIVRGLLSRALLRHFDDDPAAAQADLDEAWSLAERGPMPLFQADILLTRARLFRDRDALVKARVLIERHGYHRRDEELRDAEAVLGGTMGNG